MSSLDLSRLSAGDAEVALRSFGRRYRAELQPVGDDDRIDELAARLGPDGESALGVVSDVTRTLGLLASEIHRTLTVDEPVLHPAVADASARRWDVPPPESVDEALVLLDHELDDLLRIMGEAGNTDDWTRTGTVAGGGTRSALDLLKEAVRVGSDGVDRVRGVLASVRG
jgi:hypothetical protein